MPLRMGASTFFRSDRGNMKFNLSSIFIPQIHVGPHSLGPKETDGLLVPPGKDYTILTDHLNTGKPLWSEPAQGKWFKSNHLYI